MNENITKILKNSQVMQGGNPYVTGEKGCVL